MASTSSTIDNLKMHIPTEIIQDICQYLNPDRLHKFASCSTQASYIVSGWGMDRARYIEKWLDAKKQFYIYAYTITNANMEYELNNYWYYKLIFGDDTYNLFTKIMYRIKNKNLFLRDDCEMISRKHIEDINTYIKALGNVHTLIIRNCAGATDMVFSKLGYIHTLDLANTHITDVGLSALGNVHTLDLSYCTFITDMCLSNGTLSSVYKLCLTGCYIKNLQTLVNVHTLGLSGCKITNKWLVNGVLCNIHTLDLQYCQYITHEGFRMLNNVYKLILYGTSITNIGVRALANVNRLDTRYCYGVAPSMRKLHLN